MVSVYHVEPWCIAEVAVVAVCIYRHRILITSLAAPVKLIHIGFAHVHDICEIRREGAGTGRSAAGALIELHELAHPLVCIRFYTVFPLHGALVQRDAARIIH